MIIKATTTVIMNRRQRGMKPKRNQGCTYNTQYPGYWTSLPAGGFWPKTSSLGTEHAILYHLRSLWPVWDSCPGCASPQVPCVPGHWQSMGKCKILDLE